MSDETQGRPDDEVQLPDEPVEDLEPEGDESDEVKGGGWPVKWQGGAGGG